MAGNFATSRLGVGRSFTLARVGVDLAPGAAAESKLPALRAGGENLSAETDHSELLFKIKKARVSEPLGFYFYFIELAEMVGQFSQAFHRVE